MAKIYQPVCFVYIFVPNLYVGWQSILFHIGRYSLSYGAIKEDA